MQKLTPSELKAGMVILESVVTPSGQVLALAGEELTRQSINKMKLYRVDYAIVDGFPVEAPILEASAPAVATEEISNAPAEAPKIEKTKPEVPKTHVEETKTHSQKLVTSQEFKTFQMDYYVALSNLKDAFTDIMINKKPINEAALVSIAENLFLSRKTITELFDMLHNMRSIDDAVYAHCLNVGLISRMFGRWLHLGQQELDLLTCAGLLHDIGKLVIPDEILNKPGKLTDEEFALIRSHTQKGYDLLKSQNIDSRIKQTALLHHERNDGSGYPGGVNGDLLPDFAMIVAIADVYDAMTTARSYRVPLCPFQVIAKFEEEGFQKYNTKYIYIFLNRIATTYQSNRVMLSDGRGCKIVMLNKNALSKPMVQLDNGECIDLSTQRDLHITSVL